MEEENLYDFGPLVINRNDDIGEEYKDRLFLVNTGLFPVKLKINVLDPETLEEQSVTFEHNKIFSQWFP